MAKYEAIFAVKVFEENRGGEIIPRNTPQYHISRRTFEAESESDARDKAHREKESIKDLLKDESKA